MFSVKFIRTSVPALYSLLVLEARRKIMHAKIVSLESHPAHSTAADRVKAEKIFDALKSHTLKYSHALMQGMFDSADDTLFDMAEKAESNSDQAIYFDSMRIIRLKRKEIESSFCQQIDDLFTDYLAATSHHIEPDSLNEENASTDFTCDNLSLMEEIDLEESLAISTLSDKIRSHNATEIRAIEKRLAHIKPNTITDQETSPFDAKNICTAFQQATHNLDTETKIKLIVFKLFDQHISKSIEQLYKEINTKFIEAGILPKIKISTGHISAESALSRQDSQKKDNTIINDKINNNDNSLPNTAESENTNEILIPLQQILAQAHFSTNQETGFSSQTNISHSNTDSLASHTITTGTSEQVVAALTQLQQQNTGQNLAAMPNSTATLNPINPQEISRQFKSILNEQVSQNTGQPVNINAIDSGIIDIVSMLFEFILDDDHLPAAAKAEIARLQIPLLKVAIIDKELFNTKAHPARVLLNTLAKSGLGLDESNTTKNNRIFEKIASTVEQVINNFQNDLKVFTTLLDEFNHFILNERERDQSSEETVIKAFEKKEEVSLAQAWVNEALEDALCGKSLPEQIDRIIKGPWSKVMLHTYLEQGKDSNLWKNQLRFIDVLAWSVEPKLLSLDRKKLGNIIKHLINTLREGLNDINYPEDKLNKLFNALETYHLSSLRSIDHSETTTDNVSTSNTQPTNTFFLFEEDTHQPENEQPELNDESGFLFPESQHDSPAENTAPNDTVKLNAEPDSESNMIARAIQDIEHQVASLSELESMLEDVLEDPEEFSTDKMILEDIVLTGWEEPESPEDHPDDEYLDLARHLEAGKWVEFVNHEGKTQRAKLAWKSDLLGEYTFLNWKFDVVADKTLFGLAGDLRTGRAKVINDVPILDRALGAVLSGLNRKTA